jgi:SOS-response transcriptional repressor LexA
VIHLTDRQRQVLRAILAFQLQHGIPPILRQLVKAMGLCSTNGVWGHIQALRRKGVLTETPDRYGVLRLVGVEWLPVFDADTPQGILLVKLYREITGAGTVDFLVPKEVLS